jgi:hypothetical protein
MKKFDRFDIKNIDLNTLWLILSDDKYDLIFVCIDRENVLYRYKINKIQRFDDFIQIFNNNLLKRFENGLNSDEISVFECDFIDCYKKIP